MYKVDEHVNRRAQLRVFLFTCPLIPCILDLMLLTIDVGNTNLTLGLYDGNVLFAHWRLATDHARMPDEYGLQFLGLLQNAGHSKKELKGICLASVVPQLTGRVVQACREYLEQDPFIVDVGIKTGIRVRYEDPKAVGADRIADAVAVMYLYSGPACVIDFGTATTFNAITKEGEYLGGAITAGITLATEALFHACRKTAAHRPAASAFHHRAQHGACHAIRFVVRLREYGGGHGRTFSCRTRSGDESDRHGRTRHDRRAGNRCDSNHCALAHAGWFAHHLGSQSPVIVPLSLRGLPVE